MKNFSLNEEKMRDLYLRGLALGEIQGPPTGKASVDKPWLKYYPEKTLETSVGGKTVYEALINNPKHNDNMVALEYFGSKITFGELKKNIELTAKAFEENGVKEGSFVTICAAGVPETVYSFYALSKLGAIANMISPWFDQNQLVERIEDCKSDIVVIMDTFYDDIIDSLKKSRIKKSIILPTLNSSILGLITKKRKIDKKNNEIYWNDFVKEGKRKTTTEKVGYKKEQPLVMVYSSGTTGASKGILLTNDSFANSVDGYSKSGIDVSSGQKFYQIIPTWFSTGLSTSIHLPLVNGATVFMDPRFERKHFIKNIVKAKPNYTVAPTSMYEGFLEKKLIKNSNISSLNYPFEGGEPLSKEVREAIEKVFKAHGNNSKLKVGYGQCECGATITTELQHVEHPDGTVGIPLPGVNIGIFDENRNELFYRERGEILVDTPCKMKEYFNNDDETKKTFYVDETGKKWIVTGDIGYIDTNGNLFVEGRSQDYTIVNDEKIFNFDVENIIKTISGIKMVDVLPKEDENGNEQLAAHIILDKEYKLSQSEITDKIIEIQEKIQEVTNNESMIPYVFKIRESFPYAKSGKRDTKSMREEKDGFINMKKPENSNKVKKISK